MSTGRHAAKRAAQANEQLANQQQVLLQKEEAQKGIRDKEIESQRIATTRARFGGQAPDATASNESADPTKNRFANKSGTSPTLKTRDPLKNTIMSMYLDNTPQGQQSTNFISG